MTFNGLFRVYVLMFLIIIIWGLSWSVSKIGLQFIPPIWFAALRLLISVIVTFIFVALIGKLIIPGRNDLPLIFVMGILQMALFMVLITLGLEHVAAGRTALLVYTTPLWVMPIAILFFNENLTIYKSVGFLLGMLGLFFLFSPWGMDWSNKDKLLGNGLLLLAALCWAIAILCARNMRWYHTPLELLPWQLLVGTLPVLIIAFLMQPIQVIEWNHTSIISLLFTGIFATAFAYWCTLVISKELPSTTVSLCYLAVPVVGLVFSAIFLHEKITSIILISMLLILSGIASIVFDRDKSA